MGRTALALVMAYKTSPELAVLAEATQRDYTRYLDIAVAMWGKFNADEIKPTHLPTLRDSCADSPTTANRLVSITKTLWQWGFPRKFASINPAREVKPIKVEREGAKPIKEAELPFHGLYKSAVSHPLALLCGRRFRHIEAKSTVMARLRLRSNRHTAQIKRRA
jgi:site-specific recombinase XerD